MAFWKKSDDPWDRKPEKKTGAAWREPPEPREEVVPVVENCVENVEKSVETVEVCPWCGGEISLRRPRRLLPELAAKWKAVSCGQRRRPLLFLSKDLVLPQV